MQIEVKPAPISGGSETELARSETEAGSIYKQFIALQIALGQVGPAHRKGGVLTALRAAEAKWANGRRVEVTGGIGL